MGCNSSAQVYLENINQKPISITVLGPSNSGKTSLIEFLAGEYNITDPPVHTNGVLVRDISIDNVLYRFYDIGGLGASNQDIKECLNSSQCVFYVIDQASLQSQPKKFVECLQQSSSCVESKSIPVVFITNKVRASTSRGDPIEKVAEPFLRNSKKHFVNIGKFTDQVLTIFHWVLENVHET